MEKTINEVFKKRTDKYQDRIAVEKKLNGAWESASWAQYYDAAREAGLALRSVGVEKGDRVSILSENRLEWLYADLGTLGTLGIGGAVVPVYTTLLAEEVGYILENSGAKAVFVEDSDQMEKVLACLKDLPELKKIILIEGRVPADAEDIVVGYEEFAALGEQLHLKDKDSFERLAREVEPQDLATIVYTSGTTARPKGVMISHKNIMAILKSLASVKPTYCFDTDQVVPFLPLSHVFGRLTDHFFGMYVGGTASYAESILLFARDVKEKKPHVIQAVPRVCEKVYHKILEKVEDQPPWKQKVFSWGHKIGLMLLPP
ncbi:MAG: AMP-binding protein [Desulfobacter sp.]|nr:MAG: AMP-binding protein [Desulfobacter sp.]